MEPPQQCKLTLKIETRGGRGCRGPCQHITGDCGAKKWSKLLPRWTRGGWLTVWRQGARVSRHRDGDPLLRSSPVPLACVLFNMRTNATRGRPGYVFGAFAQYSGDASTRSAGQTSCRHFSGHRPSFRELFLLPRRADGHDFSCAIRDSMIPTCIEPPATRDAPR